MKTSELSGAALDWAVAKCEGRTITSFAGGAVWVKGKREFPPNEDLWGYDFCYNASRRWEVGGPIIEREKITVQTEDAWPPWSAYFREHLFKEDESACCHDGLTPLVAAMRCYVASKLGDEVDVPEELR